MRLPCRSLTRWIGESFGTASTQRTGRRLTLLKTSSASFDDLGVVLQDPVVAGQAAVERAVLDVARHLLGPDQRAVDFRIVDGRIVAAAGEGDLVAGLAEQFAGRLLQAAGGNAEFEDAGRSFLVHLLGIEDPFADHLQARRPRRWRKKQLL